VRNPPPQMYAADVSRSFPQYESDRGF
jgi:hypothetical protein